ncbi:MAG: SPOR domain-containing protein, partial [Deltaproteobacteria bacterium]
ELAGAEAPGAPEPRPPDSASTEVPAGPDAVPEPPAAPLSEGAPTHGWAIQVAAYEDPDQADAEVERLSGQGYAAYRTAALVAGRTWHRVRIGGYDSREDAEAAREALQDQLGVTDLIVARAP